MKYADSPTLSIVIVTRNRAALLTACLSSLSSQLTKSDQIIIVDNGSTDETPKVIASFRKRVPIRTVKTTVRSFSHIYNEGAAAATKQVIVFLDDDCTVSPHYLSAIRRAHTTHPDAVIQGTTHSVPKDNLYASIMGDHYRNWLKTMEVSPGKLKTLDNKNVSMPRSLFRRFRGFSSSMSRGSEDIELGLRIHRAGVPIILDAAVIAYHRERTTFAAFIAQHRRFAATEGHLDAVLPKNERLGLLPRKKALLHLASFIRREWDALYHARFGEALIVPFLYGTLAWIRLWGYATNR